MKKKITKCEAKETEAGRPDKEPTLIDAFNALRSMPEDFFAEAIVDSPPEDVEPW